VLGALTGMLTGELLSSAERRATITRIVREGVAVAQADGVQLPKLFGTADADDAEAIEDALRRFGERFGAIRSVTLRDFELGRPTEVDAVTGEIVRRGERLGVPTPLSAGVYSRLKAIEAGRSTPGPDHLDGL
jgi:2-dehydropantoate 2-reductase